MLPMFPILPMLPKCRQVFRDELATRRVNVLGAARSVHLADPVLVVLAVVRDDRLALPAVDPESLANRGLVVVCAAARARLAPLQQPPEEQIFVLARQIQHESEAAHASHAPTRCEKQGRKHKRVSACRTAYNRRRLSAGSEL
jgi:hypothetical protein